MVGGNMKIIDFDKKGNVVRFYLGDDNCNDYWGDDWNDTPYEHNAGSVYDRYITKYIDVYFPFDSLVLEPQDDWRNNCNSHYSKEDMKKGYVPCIIVVPSELAGETYDDTFGYWIGSKNIEKFYFNDSEQKLKDCHYMYTESDVDHEQEV